MKKTKNNFYKTQTSIEKKLVCNIWETNQRDKYENEAGKCIH